MPANHVNIDRATPMLLPPDLRDWVAEDDLVHFVLEAIDGMALPTLRVNRRGSGSAQYPPKMMLGLLIYCYANGLFSSRRIERATYRDVSVRYLTANTHPDHDTICKFRRENFDAVAQAFVAILQLAKAMGLLKVGAVSVDGTRIRASASRDRNVRYDRAQELEAQLTEDIEALLRRAEQADEEDRKGPGDGQTLPKQLDRLEKLRQKMREAQAHLQAQAKAKAEAEQAAYQRKLAEREQRQSHRKGPRLRPPTGDGQPQATDQVNLTDADSRLMRQSHGHRFEQAYNAQAAVDADGSMLVLGARVTDHANDVNELTASLQAVPGELGPIDAVLADTGYANIDAIRQFEDQPEGPELYVAVRREDNHDQRRYDYRPREATDKPPRTLTDPTLLAMAAKLRTDEGRRQYRKRKQSVEPVFGIIKSVMGFVQFLLRGLEKVRGEWSLVCLAYNVKRLWNLQRA